LKIKKELEEFVYPWDNLWMVKDFVRYRGARDIGIIYSSASERGGGAYGGWVLEAKIYL